MFQDASTPARIGWAVLAIVTSLLLRFFQKFYHHRSTIRKLPGPPHSWIWGHLKALNDALTEMPVNAHPQAMATVLKAKFGLGDIFTLDLFPFSPPMLMILDPMIVKQITTEHSLPKHEVVRDFMKHLGGPSNLVGSDGADWRKWRSAFNPGFSASHIMSLVPAIVDECSIFCEIMDRNAKDNVLFRMEQATTKLTVDIIGRVVLDEALDSQHKPNMIVESMLSIVRWMGFGNGAPNPLAFLDVRKHIMTAYHTRKMNTYIGDKLDQRFKNRHNYSQSKAVVDLALRAYLKDVKGTAIEEANSLDPEFRIAAISNMKTFLFGGHDTTSSTIAYTYYYMSKFPAMLKRLRDEHDAIFGPDPKAAGALLKKDPYLLNKLPYTMAVIREVLRYQPPASSIRGGEKGYYLQDPETGKAIPTEGFMVWPVDVGVHRNEKYWPNPDVFQPDRHLPNTSEYNADAADAWIAFSKGPRNCIGQELAIIETKVILALTMRSYDFLPAFDELEKLKGDGSGYPSDTRGVQTLFGDEAYQITLGTAKPREGMPCRLRLRL